MACKDRKHVLFAFFVCGRQRPEYPNWSSMADKAITRGGIGGLGSLVLICGGTSSKIDINTRHIVR